MGLTEVQGVLARLFVDPALRQRFFADPAAVGAELGLNVAEAQGLACVSRRQVDQFADSLRRKRRDQVRRVVPMAARALGPRFAELFERHATESPPRGSKADLDDAAAFVETLRRWAGQVEPPWAVDLARYELAWRQAARAGRVPIVRVFRFPVVRLARGQRPVAARTTLALWWKPTRRGRVRHFVIATPAIAAGRG
jgi:hypothetical protein